MIRGANEKVSSGGGGLAGWVGVRAKTSTSELFMNINKNRKPRTCQLSDSSPDAALGLGE